MQAIQRILVPTDFSDSSAAGAEYASDLARKLGASVELIHVVETASLWSMAGAGILGNVLGQIRQDAERRLAGFAGKHFAGVTLNRHVREGNPALEILRAAGEAGCNAIVMSTHGRTGPAHLLIGSVAEKVVRKSPVPVLTVRAA